MPFIKILAQEALILAFRPLIVREMRGWRTMYKIFIGYNNQRDWFWQGRKKRRIKGKLNDFWMELDLSHWSSRFAFFVGRWYDLPTQLLLEQVLKEGDEVIDVGANIGMFSLAARRCVGSEGIIYAFEPNPNPRQQLQHHIEINQIENIKVYSVGLGETEGEFTLYVPYSNSGEGSLSGFPDDHPEKIKHYKIQVDIKVGDDLLQKAAPRLIKIDVEGAEVSVLKGLSKLIDQHRPLILAEYVPEHISRFNKSFEDILLIAKEHSYKVFKLGSIKINGNHNLSLIPVKNSKIAKPCDILLCHTEDPYIQQIQDRE